MLVLTSGTSMATNFFAIVPFYVTSRSSRGSSTATLKQAAQLLSSTSQGAPEVCLSANRYSELSIFFTQTKDSRFEM